MKENLTKKETGRLEKLLLKVIKSGRWWPNEKTFQLAHGIVSAWAPELVITRTPRKFPKEILLTVYGGGAKKFKGLWHLPGGYDAWDLPSIAADCEAIARRELDIKVKFTKILGAYKWKPGEHPYGRPLSLFAACVPKTTIRETKTMKFFPIKKLPKNMVACHKRFLKQHFVG
ncbi:MAG: hypothetical protein HY434_00460 [Candidatus Liptonbacteria bacterium]|nr:hypothetical protein [Candidatus Liptonbacteria bacterium]